METAADYLKAAEASLSGGTASPPPVEEDDMDAVVKKEEEEAKAQRKREFEVKLNSARIYANALVHEVGGPRHNYLFSKFYEFVEMLGELSYAMDEIHGDLVQPQVGG